MNIEEDKQLSKDHIFQLSRYIKMWIDVDKNFEKIREKLRSLSI